jgi:hypothetical protein
MPFNITDLVGYRMLEQQRVKDAERRQNELRNADLIAQNFDRQEKAKQDEFDRALKVAELDAKTAQMTGESRVGSSTDPQLQFAGTLGRRGAVIDQRAAEAAAAEARAKRENDVRLRELQEAGDSERDWQHEQNANQRLSWQLENALKIAKLTGDSRENAARIRGPSGSTTLKPFDPNVNSWSNRAKSLVDRRKQINTAMAEAYARSFNDPAAKEAYLTYQAQLAELDGQIADAQKKAQDEAMIRRLVDRNGPAIDTGAAPPPVAQPEEQALSPLQRARQRAGQAK